MLVKHPNPLPTLSFFLMLTFFLWAPVSSSGQCTLPPTQPLFANGSFETADLSGWNMTDCPNRSNFMAPQVSDLNGYSPGFGFRKFTIPDGDNIMVMGIDGQAPCEVSLCQTITIPDTATCASLTWKEVFEWVYTTPVNPGEEKVFSVNVVDTSTGTILESLHTILLDGSFILPSGSAYLAPNGWSEMEADVSAYIGQTIGICFTGTVPTSYSGPALLQLDAIAMNMGSLPPPPPPPAVIPTMSQWALIWLGLFLFTLGIVVLYNLEKKSILR